MTGPGKTFYTALEIFDEWEAPHELGYFDNYTDAMICCVENAFKFSTEENGKKHFDAEYSYHYIAAEEISPPVEYSNRPMWQKDYVVKRMWEE